MDTLEDRQQVDETMHITDEERSWAMAAKQVVEESAELTNLTDMQYAEFAIATEGNLQEALRQIQGVQLFREHYKIDNSVEQGEHLLRGLLEQQPGVLLNVDVDLNRNFSINAFDFGMLDPQMALGKKPGVIETRGIEGNWGVYVGGLYYTRYASQPSLAVVRNGLLELSDFKDFGWENFSEAVISRMFEEIMGMYPTKWKQLMVYNTGWLGIIAITLSKPLMSKSMRNTITLGWQIMESEDSQSPANSLKDFYLQPTREVANQNLLRRSRMLLAMRKQNEETFRL